MTKITSLLPLCLAGAVAAVPLVGSANADLEKQMSNPKNWAAQAGDMKNHRYSV
jgi:lanthanide-dependent methanol dehydrogenase